jgi:hypothetical protein
MRIRLTKKWESKAGSFAFGTVLEVTDDKAKELINDRSAIRYEGDYPPTEKMKTEFFKPTKNIKRNVKG